MYAVGSTSYYGVYLRLDIGRSEIVFIFAAKCVSVRKLDRKFGRVSFSNCVSQLKSFRHLIGFGANKSLFVLRGAGNGMLPGYFEPYLAPLGRIGGEFDATYSLRSEMDS